MGRAQERESSWRPDVLAMLSSTWTGTNDRAPTPVDPLDSNIFPALPPWFSGRRRHQEHRQKKVVQAECLEKIKAFGKVYLDSLKAQPHIRTRAGAYTDKGIEMLKAASEGRPKLLELEELLVNKRVDANFVNQEGFCALHSATFNGHLLSVKMLLRHGANVNLACTNETFEGWTALHFAACASDDLEMIEYLLLNGADPAATTSDGETPCSLAAALSKPATVTDKLTGGNLLQTELKKLGLWTPRMRSILQANEIDTLGDLDSVGLWELTTLQDKGGVTRVTLREAMQIWESRYPGVMSWAAFSVKLLLVCFIMYICVAMMGYA